mgnify:CR=1 FL=1
MKMLFSMIIIAIVWGLLTSSEVGILPAVIIVYICYLFIKKL